MTKTRTRTAKSALSLAALAASLLLHTSPAAGSYVRPGRECPNVDDTSFCYRGGEYKFLGINLQAIAHLDRIMADKNPTAEEIENEWQEQLTAARDIGVSVIRIFAPHKEKTPAQARQSVLAFMNKASQVYGDQEVKFLITLTDFYNNPNKATTEQDNAYDGDGYLHPSWFVTGGAQPNYEGAYKTFIDGFIVPPLTTDPRVFAWQLGNEIQSGRGDDNAGARERMLGFAYTMGYYIKSTRGAQQMVTTGFIGTNHAVAGEHHGWIDNSVCQIYHYWVPGATECNAATHAKNSPFDFVYIHGYNNEWSDPPCNNCSFPHQWQEVDIAWANANGRPYVIGELAFNGAYKESGQCSDHPFPGGTWGNVTLPQAGNNRARKSDGGDGVTAVALSHFFNTHSADGILHWGYMVKRPDPPDRAYPWPNNRLGDHCSGMGNVLYADGAEMDALFHYWSTQLPRGGSLEITGAIHVPASGMTLHTGTTDNDPETRSFTVTGAVISSSSGGTLDIEAEDATEIFGEVILKDEVEISGSL